MAAAQQTDCVNIYDRNDGVLLCSLREHTQLLCTLRGLLASTERKHAKIKSCNEFKRLKEVCVAIAGFAITHDKVKCGKRKRPDTEQAIFDYYLKIVQELLTLIPGHEPLIESLSQSFLEKSNCLRTFERIKSAFRQVSLSSMPCIVQVLVYLGMRVTPPILG